MPMPSRDAGTMMVNETTSALLARVVCEREAACCPGNTRGCDSLARVLGSWLENEAVEVDPTALDACVAALEAADCDTIAAYAGRPPIARFCPNLSRGTLPNGGTCRGLFDDEQCASGHCLDGTCGDALGENAMCSPGDCGDGLACHLGECVRPTAGGASCEQRSVCEEGYECFRQMGEMEARCHPLVTIQPGETCEAGTLCSLGEDQCWCPEGMTGCLRGLCGNRSRCLP